jgi:hypothetical protein
VAKRHQQSQKNRKELLHEKNGSIYIFYFETEFIVLYCCLVAIGIFASTFVSLNDSGSILKQLAWNDLGLNNPLVSFGGNVLWLTMFPST